MAVEEELAIPAELRELGAPHSEDFHKLVYGFAYRFYENGKSAEAVRFFRFLTMLNPFHLDYWKGLAAARQLHKDYDKALEAYGVAIGLDSSQHDPYLHLHAADCFLAKDEVAQALQALDSAQAIAAKQADADQLLSHIGLMRRAWKKKMKSIKQLRDHV